MSNILAIDPGTNAGVALITEENRFIVEAWNVAHEKATKIKANGTQLRKGEPKHFRLLHLWNRLCKMKMEYDFTKVVCEGALGFMKGKSAVEASHKFRGVIELYCAISGIEYIEVQPNDLKFFALGKRSGDKEEMIQAAVKMGYNGNDDDEADAYIIAKWYINTQNHLKELI